MAAQGAFGTDFYGRSTRTIVGTMLWTGYRPVIKIGPKSALGRHEIRPIHSAPSLGQSIDIELFGRRIFNYFWKTCLRSCIETIEKNAYLRDIDGTLNCFSNADYTYLMGYFVLFRGKHSRMGCIEFVYCSLAHL